MTDILFSALELSDELQQSIAAMGFETATPIQAQTIPLIRTGVDVIAKSQTGTGKTVAFAVPALECIDTMEAKTSVQVLILCPTRELAQQAGDEIRKLAKFMPGIRQVELYGGTDMERQFIRLRRANLVIGTPGRVMDHLRRRTLQLDQLSMVVLDEADEMLNMGFKEDIETILQDAAEDRQTILFSATMPPAILALARQFQRDPETVEIDRGQVTIQNIDQSFVEVPQDRKGDALTLLLEYHRPQRALVFCNTKRMVDELTQLLNGNGFAAEGIHGDLSQSQRTSVMAGFKGGRISTLVATDVAARGIDVNDLDYVFNYDIPMTTDYYVHRIGRTGRAGKDGSAITLCCGKRQIHVMRGLAKAVKAEIRQDNLPSTADLQAREWERNLTVVETALAREAEAAHTAMVKALLERGHSLEDIAAAALGMHFPVKQRIELPVSTFIKSRGKFEERTTTKFGKHRPESVRAYTDLLFDIGSSNRVAANHLVGAITERTGISGKEIGKIQVYAEQSVVAVPTAVADDVIAAMRGCKICGKPAHVLHLASIPEGREIRSRKSGRSMMAAPSFRSRNKTKRIKE